MMEIENGTNLTVCSKNERQTLFSRRMGIKAQTCESESRPSTPAMAKAFVLLYLLKQDLVRLTWQ